MNPDRRPNFLLKPLLAASAFVAISCGADKAPSQPPEPINCTDASHTLYRFDGASLPKYSQTEDEYDIYFCINLIRQNNGNSPLVLHRGLSKIARARSKDMATNGYFSHIDPNGNAVFAYMEGQCSSPYDFAGENLSMNNHKDTVKEAIGSWVGSEKHLENMLKAEYLFVGIGEAVDADGIHFFTTVFSSEAC